MMVCMVARVDFQIRNTSGENSVSHLIVASDVRQHRKLICTTPTASLARWQPDGTLAITILGYWHGILVDHAIWSSLDSARDFGVSGVM
jgi:hypothetical protein